MDIKYHIAREAEKAIRDKTFPGCVVGVVYADGSREVFPFGSFTYEQNSPSVKADTIYDIASVTKAIPTGALALQLIDQGKLNLNDRLIEHLPEFNNSDRENVLIKHLLTYTLDGYGLATALHGTDGVFKQNSTADDVKHILLSKNFERRPGAVFTYSNITAALMGLVIERVTARTLDKFAQEQFFTPLEMSRTTFFPEHFSNDEIAPTELSGWRGLVQGIVHDESAYICKKGGKIMGHAGLFSTAPDLLNFLEVLLHHGTIGNQTFFSKNTVELMQTNQIEELHNYTGLGWELNQPRYMGKYSTTHTFGKTGFTGTLCVGDVSKGVAYVILSNRTYPKRPKDGSAINAFRNIIGEIILKQ